MSDLNKHIETFDDKQYCISILEGPLYSDNPQDILEFKVTHSEHLDIAKEELSEISLILESAFKPALSRSEYKNVKYIVKVHILHSIEPFILILPLVFKSVVSLLKENNIVLYDTPKLIVKDGIYLIILEESKLITSVFGKSSLSVESNQ